MILTINIYFGVTATNFRTGNYKDKVEFSIMTKLRNPVAYNLKLTGICIIFVSRQLCL